MLKKSCGYNSLILILFAAFTLTQGFSLTNCFLNFHTDDTFGRFVLFCNKDIAGTVHVDTAELYIK